MESDLLSVKFLLQFANLLLLGRFAIVGRVDSMAEQHLFCVVEKTLKRRRENGETIKRRAKLNLRLTPAFARISGHVNKAETSFLDQKHVITKSNPKRME